MGFFVNQNAYALQAQLRHRLVAPELLLGAGFGSTVSMTNDYVVVAESNWPDFERGVGNAGRVHIYDLHNGQLVRTLYDPNPGSFGGAFGAGLAVGDGTVFVGTRLDSVSAFDLATGERHWTLSNPSFEGTDFNNSSLGSGLAYSQGKLLATAASFTIPFVGNVGGGVLLNSTTGDIERYYPNPEPADGDGLGVLRSFGMSGSTVALGGPLDCREAGESGGCVWLFDRNSGETIARIENPTPWKYTDSADLGDFFAVSLTLNDTLIVIGDKEDDYFDPNVSVPDRRVGSAYVFDANTGKLLSNLKNPSPFPDADFAADVEVTPSGLVWVGSDLGIVGNELDYSGRAYLFDSDSGELLLTLTSPNSQNNGLFGFRLNVLGDRWLAVTAAGEGTVYIYEVVPEPSARVLLGIISIALYLVQSLFHTKGFCHVASQHQEDSQFKILYAPIF